MVATACMIISQHVHHSLSELRHYGLLICLDCSIWSLFPRWDQDFSPRSWWNSVCGIYCIDVAVHLVSEWKPCLFREVNLRAAHAAATVTDHRCRRRETWLRLFRYDGFWFWGALFVFALIFASSVEGETQEDLYTHSFRQQWALTEACNKEEFKAGLCVCLTEAAPVFVSIGCEESALSSLSSLIFNSDYIQRLW